MTSMSDVWYEEYFKREARYRALNGEGRGGAA